MRTVRLPYMTYSCKYLHSYTQHAHASKVSHIGGDKGWWRAAKTRLSSIFVQHFRFGLRLYLCQKDPKGVIVVVVVALIGWLILVSTTRSFPLLGW